eukprot:222623_1
MTEIPVEVFNRYVSQNIHYEFFEDILSKIPLLHQKIKQLHLQYGRGALLIHFNTFQSYIQKQIQPINEVLNIWRHPIVHWAVQQDPSSFIINDYILWLPIKSLDSFCKVSSTSCLRFYPLSSHFVTMVMTYKDESNWHYYYSCIRWPSLIIHPNPSFKSKYAKFLSNISLIKFKIFKKRFPIFYKQLIDANEIKKYPICLLRYSLPAM